MAALLLAGAADDVAVIPARHADEAQLPPPIVDRPKTVAPLTGVLRFGIVYGHHKFGDGKGAGMAIHLKQGRAPEAIRSDSERVSATVRDILADLEARGDAAVRAWSEKLDRWNPPSFRLSQAEIDGLLASLPPQTLDDIAFAQAQIRGFAQAQKDALKDIEITTLPGVTLGHKNIPVNSVGCYVPGGRYPMVASAHMSIVTAKVAGVQRIIACTPPTDGAAHAATIAAMTLGGAD